MHHTVNYGIVCIIILVTLSWQNVIQLPRSWLLKFWRR